MANTTLGMAHHRRSTVSFHSRVCMFCRHICCSASFIVGGMWFYSIFEYPILFQQFNRVCIKVNGVIQALLVIVLLKDSLSEWWMYCTVKCTEMYIKWVEGGRGVRLMFFYFVWQLCPAAVGSDSFLAVLCEESSFLWKVWWLLFIKLCLQVVNSSRTVCCINYWWSLFFCSCVEKASCWILKVFIFKNKKNVIKVNSRYILREFR